MILRRVIKHFRQQEWTAIFLDFLIVVVGVFVGLQVSNWNELRGDQEDETAFLERLASDIETELKGTETLLKSATADKHLLEQAIFIVQSNDTDVVLTTEQCRIAWQSHVLGGSYAFNRLLSVEALSQSRGLGILSDTDLQLALISYQRAMDYSANLANFIISDVKNLVDDYPEIFPRTLLPDVSSRFADCQLDAMRASRAVRNKLLSNHGRLGGITAAIEKQVKLLRQLQSMVKRNTRQ
ncbi:MAG: hypothetical protein COA84_10265 [Robiginitomaculum sp.]|nr:MAG: hypothetical protein COA84_10265 [Robiginitomaculum sp.]